MMDSSIRDWTLDSRRTAATSRSSPCPTVWLPVVVADSESIQDRPLAEFGANGLTNIHRAALASPVRKAAAVSGLQISPAKTEDGNRKHNRFCRFSRFHPSGRRSHRSSGGG